MARSTHRLGHLGHQEEVGLDVERLRQPIEPIDAQTVFPSFERAHICPVDARSVGQRLLRQALPRS